MAILLTIIFSFFPVLVWGYLFSYLDGDKANKKRFFIGLISGSIGILPIIFYNQIFEFFYLDYLLFVFDKFTFTKYIVLILLFISLITILTLIISLFFSKFKYFFLHLLKTIGIFLVFTLIISSILMIFKVNDIFQNIKVPDNNLSLSGIGIRSFVILMFYYLFIGTIEEFSKFANYLGTSFQHTKTIQKGMLYSIFIGLGFVFAENIIYFFNYISNSGLNSSFMGILFTRSIFSMSLHILCSLIIVYFFLESNFKNKKSNFYSFFIIFLGIFVSILLHSSFDILLHYGFSFVLILSFIIAYFFITAKVYK